MSIPNTQKAWVTLRRGIPSRSLELRKDWPVSKDFQPGEVLVKIQAAALNPVGYKLMKWAPNFIGRPYIVEHDFSGTIADANGSSEFTNGEEIFGWIGVGEQIKSKQGALSEYIRIPEVNIVKRPSHVSAIQSAGILLTALTAHQGLELAGLEAGQTILIYGGGTAVGQYAIQLAKIRGAKVVVAASGSSESRVREAGADEFIDYTKIDEIHTHLTKNPPSTKYNAIYDTYGVVNSSFYTRSAPYLAPNGVFVTVGYHGISFGAIPQAIRLLGAFIFPSFITGIKQTYKTARVANVAEHNRLLGKYLEEGKIKPAVDSVFEFEDALKAYERIVSGKAAGKITIKVDPSIPSV